MPDQTTPLPKAKLMRSALDAAGHARHAADDAEFPPEHPINGSAVLLLLVLATDAWPHDDGDGWACRASLAALALRCGLARSTVQRAARALADAGLVRRFGTEGSCLYVLTTRHPEPPAAAPVTARGRTDDRYAAVPMTGTGGARDRYGVYRPSVHVLEEVQDFQDSNTSSTQGKAAADRAGTEARAAGAGGDLSDSGGMAGGLSGSPAGQLVAEASRRGQAARMLRERPGWVGGPWLDRRTVARLVDLETTTPDAVAVALAETRQRAETLSNPAGYLIRWLEDPDAEAIAAHRDKRERTRAEREARAEREEARRIEAERRTAEAVAGQRACLDRVDDEHGPAETDARIARYVAGLDNPVVRDLLAGRTDAERREYLAKTGRAAEAVLGDEWAGGATALPRAGGAA